MFAWRRTLADAGLPIDGWRIDRRIVMNGGPFAQAAARGGAFRVYRGAEELREWLDEPGVLA